VSLLVLWQPLSTGRCACLVGLAVLLLEIMMVSAAALLLLLLLLLLSLFRPGVQAIFTINGELYWLCAWLFVTGPVAGHQLVDCTTKSNTSYAAALQQLSYCYSMSQASSTQCGLVANRAQHLALHGCVAAGETGKSVSQYSAEWLKTVPLMRSVIKGNKPLSNSDVLVRQTLHRRPLAWLSRGTAYPWQASVRSCRMHHRYQQPR